MPKRQADIEKKTDGDAQVKQLKSTFTHEEIHSFLSKKIFESSFQDSLQSTIAESQPYKWGTVTELMDDTLLRNVRKEVLNEIAFTKKETDIYKVYQSGDLANLSGLDWNDLSRLPSLFKLRAAIYSEEFRDFISKVTGCGKLSGTKTDMSINTYTKGCHLLTHDDVIGSRRVSFILYMPEPDHTWKAHYGGALRLFPAIVPNVPKTDFEAKLIPQFNQIAFFTVQPGLSFHDVEEVRVDKQRLSIQGWFHIPQEGEPGYVPGEQEETEAKSTLLVDINGFLNDEYAEALRKQLRATELDKKAPQTADEIHFPWKCAVPPHKQRFMYIDGKSEFALQEDAIDMVNHTGPQELPNFELTKRISQDTSEEMVLEVVQLMKSMAFRKWLVFVTDVVPTSDQLLARRFRPGHDFILATTTEKELARQGELNVLLEATLGLTPTAANPNNWESGEYGGYELCMAMNGGESDDEFEDDDPAIYKTSESDDSVLYTSQCKWNSLSLMLRDPSVLKFVKYVSINAKGSRWDVTGQWNVKSTEDDEDEQEENK
ncbi:hypothetical protein HF325_000856 [Metschnikowia pulcherrima]|uniref:uS12 prolyl 3,4-dihydroxylase n=1 Tax=Metschnikowia pulcherrima TaxID=27326 RepID=A0A8H7LEC5_9ASCO|nr:hypothetical protein HF325_000856 [Metschnikowia pulcherrima]